MADIKNTTLNDVQDAAAEKLENLKESAEETLEEGVEKLDGLSTNKKLLITGVTAVVVAAIVSRVVTHFRAVRVDESTTIEGDLVVVLPEDVQEA